MLGSELVRVMVVRAMVVVPGIAQGMAGDHIGRVIVVFNFFFFLIFFR